MPVFSYKGLSAAGKPVSGVKDADSLKTLRANLRRKGIFLQSAHESNVRASPVADGAAATIVALLNPLALIKLWQARKDADRRQIAILTRQLAVLLKAGGLVGQKRAHPNLFELLAGASVAVADRRHDAWLRAFAEGLGARRGRGGGFLRGAAMGKGGPVRQGGTRPGGR